MSADLTLYGSTDSDGTTFLYANTTYVMTLTQDGESTSLEFELPAYMTDKIVTSVDVENNKITVVSSFKTGETGELWTDQNNNDEYDLGEEDELEFNVAGKYDGNLGSLIGRTVNFQYDTDLNLTAFSVDDAEVVYGAMQYVNDDSALTLKKGYYKDKLTGKKYYNSATSSSTKNITRVYTAYDGDFVGLQPTLVPPVEYNYVKLVLNPDGTVSTANIDTTLALNLYVTDIDGTKVIQDGNNGVDLDGYIIVKDDKYITPDELEMGDVVFIDTTNKFADVYNNEITGSMDNVISGKLDLDGKTYNWNGAQYYDEADDKYKTLSTTDDDEGAQNYLNSLDPDEDVTIWISRAGNIRYIEGVETGVVTTTDVTYLIIEKAKSYQESLKDMLKIKVFDGTDTDDLVIKMDGLKYYNGVAGKYTDSADWQTNTNGTITFAGTSDASENITTQNVATLFPAGELMVVTYDEAGNAIGLKSHESTALGATGTLDNTHKLFVAGSPNLSASTSMVTTTVNATANNKFNAGSFTNLWIWNEKTTVGDTSDDKFTKVALTDFTNEVITNENTNLISIAYRTNGTKATDLVVRILNDDAYKANDTNTIVGMLTGTTKKNNSDNNAQVINTITILGTDGEKATFYGDGTLAAITDAKVGDYVTLTQDKVTEKISAATKTADWQYKTNSQAEDGAIGMLADGRDYDNAKLVLTDSKELTTVEGGAILLRYVEEGSVKHKVVTYSDVNTITGPMKVWYNRSYVSDDGTKIQSDMIVVESEDAYAAAVVTLDASKIEGLTQIAAGTIGTVTVNDATGALTYKLEKSTDQVTWTDTSATVTNTSGTLSVAGAVDLAASTFYRVSVATTSLLYNGATSNVVKSDAAIATMISTAEGSPSSPATELTAGTGKVADIDAPTAGGITFDGTYLVLDQYSKKMTGTGSITDFTQGNSSATATLGWNAAGKLVGTYTNGGAAGTETLVFEGTTITISQAT